MIHHSTIIALTLLLTSCLPAGATTRPAMTWPGASQTLPDDPEFRQALTKLQDMLKKSLPAGWGLVLREGLFQPFGWPESSGVQITLRPKGGPTKKKSLRRIWIMAPGYDGGCGLSRHYHRRGRETMRWRGRRVIAFRWPAHHNAEWKERLPDIRRAFRETDTLEFSPAELPNVLSVNTAEFNSRNGRLKCYITAKHTNWKPQVVSIAARAVEITTFAGRTVPLRKPFKRMEIILNNISQGGVYMVLDKAATGVSPSEILSVRLEYQAVIAGKSERLKVGPVEPDKTYRVNAPVRLDIETSRVPGPSGDLLRARITLYRDKRDARIAKGREIGQYTYLSRRPGQGNMGPREGILKRGEALREGGDKRVETVFFQMDRLKPDQPAHLGVHVPRQLSLIRGTANLLLPRPRPRVDLAFGTRLEQLGKDEIIELVLAATGERGDRKAARRLIELGEPAIAPLVRVLGMDGHGIEVGNAKNILTRIGTPAVPALIQAVKDGVGRHGGTPAWVLAQIGDSRAVDPIIEALESDYQEPKPKGHWWIFGGRHAQAARALGRLGDRRAVDCLKQALLSNSAIVRRNAAWALGEIGDPRAVAPLQKLTGNSLAQAGKKAREALQKIRMFGPVANKKIPFSQGPPVSHAEAVAPIRGKDVAGGWGKGGTPELLKMKWSKKIGLDKNDRPTVLAVLHTYKRYTAQVLRFYGIDGEKYHPQFELAGTDGVFEPLQQFKLKGHRFVVVWLHNIGSAGGGPQWILWTNGPKVQSIPYSDPAGIIGKLVRDGERRTGCWYLKGGHKALSFTISTRRPEQAAVNVSAEVRGTFRLITDSAGRPLRFEVNSAKRHPMDDIPPKSPATQPGNKLTSRPSTSTRPTTTTSAAAVEPACMEEEPLTLGGAWNLPDHDPAFKDVPTKELPAYVLGQKVLENPSWLDQHGNTRYVEPFRYAGQAGQEKALNVFIARLRTQADRQLYQQLVKDLVSRVDAPTGKDTADTWAVKFLGRLGARGALRQMLGERKDPFDWIGREMLTALSQVGDQRDVPLLIALAGREDQASAALVNKALGHMMAASPLPLQQNGRTDAGAWQAWWDYRPGEGLLRRAEAAAAQKSAMRKIEFIPEAFAAIIVPAEARTVEMVARSTQPGVPDKRTLIPLVISYRLSRYVTLKDVWVGYSQGHGARLIGATLIDARTGRWPKPDAGEQGRISAVMAATPAQKALLEKAHAIRARFPNGGVKMWEGLADLLGPGMTVQDVQLILAPLQFNSMMFQGAGWGYMGRPEEGVSVSVSNAWTAVDRRLPVAAWPINAKPHVRLEQDAPATQPAPTTQPAVPDALPPDPDEASTQPASAPAPQPGVRSADRVKKLKAHLGTFYLELDWDPGSHPPYLGHTWRLTTKPLPEYMPPGGDEFLLSWDVPGKPLVPSGRSTVRISEKLAGRMIDYLAREGFFARAKTAAGQVTLKADKPTTVLLAGTSGHDYLCYEVLDEVRPKKLSAFVRRTFDEATVIRDARLAAAREALVGKAIALQPRKGRIDRNSNQNPTGLDFSDVLKWSGQKSFVERFTKAPKPYDEKIDELKIDSYTDAEQTRVWALCALLNHPDIDVKIRAARALAAGPYAFADAVPAVLAAAKSNNYWVGGSESATLHMIYRSTLKKALEKITREALTPRGLKVITYPQPGKPKTIRSEDDPRYFRERVDFKKVEVWLRDVFLSWSPGVTRELERWGKGRKCYLDLDTAKVFAEPEGLADEKTRTAWCAKMGIDLVCDMRNIPDPPGRGFVLVGVDLQAAGGLYRTDTTWERWWDMRASRARALLGKADPPGRPVLPWSSYVFKTREGRVGQLDPFEATDKKLKLRYRFVRPKMTTTSPASRKAGNKNGRF